jgi:putative transposase
MRQLNGVFTQTSNRCHHRGGHLFQGRYKAILVDADAYLLELIRYVVLNPVRAVMVDHPGMWTWSSYNAMIGVVPAPTWLAIDKLLSQFASKRREAMQRYKEFVEQGLGKEPIWRHLNRQVFLGDDDFVQRMQQKAKVFSEDFNIPKAQRRPPALPMEKIAKAHATRNEAIITMHKTGAYSYSQIAAYFNLHFTTVGNIVRRAKVKV